MRKEKPQGFVSSTGKMSSTATTLEQVSRQYRPRDKYALPASMPIRCSTTLISLNLPPTNEPSSPTSNSTTQTRLLCLTTKSPCNLQSTILPSNSRHSTSTTSMACAMLICSTDSIANGIIPTLALVRSVTANFLLAHTPSACVVRTRVEVGVARNKPSSSES